MTTPQKYSRLELSVIGRYAIAGDVETGFKAVEIIREIKSKRDFTIADIYHHYCTVNGLGRVRDLSVMQKKEFICLCYYLISPGLFALPKIYFNFYSKDTASNIAQIIQSTRHHVYSTAKDVHTYFRIYSDFRDKIITMSETYLAGYICQN